MAIFWVVLVVAVAVVVAVSVSVSVCNQMSNRERQDDWFQKELEERRRREEDQWQDLIASDPSYLKFLKNCIDEAVEEQEKQKWPKA